MLTDSSQGYGRISQVLHWSTVLLLCLIIPSVVAYRLAGDENPITVFLGPMHRPTGLLLWVLGVTRILWAFSQRGHRPTRSGTLGTVAWLGHASLYAILIVTPTLGFLVDYGSGNALEAFGVTILTEGPEVTWAKTLGETLHLPLGWTFCSLVFAHIFMALYHQTVLKDGTLDRMIKVNH